MELLDAILQRYGYARARIREIVYHHTSQEREFYARRNVERYQQEKFTNIGVGALVFHPSGDGRMLFVKEKRLAQGKEVEQWGTPGGGAVEGDNLAEDALQREIREETGIEVEIGQLHLVDRVIGRDRMGETLYDFFFLTFDAQALNEDIHPHDPKTISAAWMKTLPKGMLLREDYELVLQRLKRTKFSEDK
ncbi:MAG: NUDIX hydrolase [Candidatus Heimdallarchaeota archaeon]